MQSQRASAVEYQQALTYSFWPWRLVSLLAPDFFGSPGSGNFWGYASYWEDHAYLGVLLLIMALGSTGILFAKRNGVQTGWISKPLAWLLWSIMAAALVLSFGLFTPIFPFLYRNVPTFDMFQAPARMMIWLVIAIILLGAAGIDRWRYPSGKGLYWLRLGTAGAFAVALGAGLGWVFLHNVKLTFIQATALAGGWALGVGLLGLLIRLRDRPGWKVAWPLMAYALVLIDLLSAGWSLNPMVPAGFYAETASTTSDLASRLKGQRVFLSHNDEYFLKFNRFLRFRDYRAYEDRSRLKQALLPDINLLDGLALSANFDPLVPDRYATWMSVVNRLPHERRRNLLAMMNVGVVEQMSAKDMSGVQFSDFAGGFPAAFYSCVKPVALDGHPLLQMAQQGFSSTTLWVETSQPEVIGSCLPNRPIPASLKQGSPNRLEVNVSAQSGWLFISQVWYPGWTAEIDGAAAPIYRANYAFMAVNVPPGSQKVELIYRPIPYQVGALLSILILVVLLFLIITHRRSTRRMDTNPADPAHRRK